MQAWRVRILLVAFLAIVLGACSEEEEISRAPTSPSEETQTYSAAELDSMGWEAFDEARFATALEYFSQAVELPDVQPSSRLGLAWSMAYWGDLEVWADAAEIFADLAEEGFYSGLCLLGRAAVLVWIEPDSAAASALAALETGEEFAYGESLQFDASDAHFLLAEAYYRAAEYALAQAEVDILDPENGLDPESSDTWVVDGVRYETYEQALAAEIQYLRVIFGLEVPQPSSSR